MKKFNYIGIIGLILTLIAASTLLPSCREKPAISNQVIVTAIGMEQQGDTYRLSIQAVEALKTAGSLSEQSENATAVYRTEGNSVAQALQEFLNETGRSTYILHNQIISLGLEQYRERSLFDSLDYFVRNLEGRSLVNLVICRGDPSALLEIQSGNDAIPSEYVSQLLKEGASWGITKNARLLDAQRASGGMYDLFLPIVTVEDETPRLDGTALFRDGYLVGELNTAQTMGLLFAADEIEKCLYTVEGVTFRITDSRSRLDIRPIQEGFQYTFDISGKADIVETRHGETISSDKKEELTALLEKRICEDVETAVKLAVMEYGCDPLALARQTAKQQEGVTQRQAEELLKQGEYTVTADIRLIESGFVA
jgi:Ger(x)C family germination protein